MKKIFLTAAIIFTLATPVFVSAQGLKDANKILGQVANPEQTGLSGDLAGTVASVIKAVLALVGTIFLILTIYAGLLWMTAQGEEEKVTKAKDIIKASVIGLVVIMSAYAITYFVTSRLVGSAGTSTPSGQSNVTGCCYATNSHDGTCTPGGGLTQSECAGAQGPGVNTNWSAGACEATCPQISL